MKNLTSFAKIALIAITLFAATAQAQEYTPSPENIKARQEFEESRFGIFIHWGIYSMFAQGE